MKLSTRPFRWFAILLLLLVASAMLLVAGSTFWRPGRPRPPGPPPPAAKEAVDAPTPPRRGDEPRAPRVWAIAIGIDQYQDEAIPACHGAVRDARAVGRWFAETAGWGPESVLYMDDLGQAEPGAAGDRVEDLMPTRANLDWAFRNWLGARVRPDDVVVVFFAGQSAALPHADGAYLLPVDARLEQLGRTGWRLDEAIDPWAATGRNPIVCWLDTSLHGRGRGLPSSDAGGPTPAVASLLPGLVRWPGVTAWLAAEGQPAAEALAVGAASPFTSALLAGLGTPERPANLLACLGEVSQDHALARQGFRMLGGIDPNLTLWSSRARQVGLSRRELLLQRGHAGGIAALAFTADGDRLITGAQDSTIKVWSVSERTVLRAFASHLVGVTCLDVSPDGRWLASGDGSGRLRLWDLSRDQDVPTGPLHDRGVEAVAFLRDGEHLVTLDLDGASWFWNTANPATQVRPLAGESTGLAVARRRGSIAFALAGADGKLQPYGPECQALKALDGPGGAVVGRRLATDGRLLAAADDDRRVMLWDAATDSVVYRATLDAPIDALALAPGEWLAVAAGREVVLVALDAGAPEVRARVSLPDPANLLTFSNDGRWLAAGTATGSVRLWRLTDGGRAEPLALEDAEETGRAAALAFAPDGRRLVAGDQDGGLRTWGLPDGRQRPRSPSRRGQVAGLSVSGDGRYLLQVTQDWQAQVWDLQEGRGLLRIAGTWTSGAIAPDGETLYLTDAEDGDVVAVDRASGRRRPTRFERPGAQGGPGATSQRFARLTVSRDGRRIAAGSTEGPLACVWDAANGRLTATLRGHHDPHPITAVSLSDDARRLLTASEDGTARLWNLDHSDPSQPQREPATYTLAGAAEVDPVPVTAAALAPDRPLRVVAGGIDGRVVLWEEGVRRTPDLGRMEHAVRSATFTSDGRWLAATGADKTVWLWDLKTSPRRVRLEPLPHHAEQVNALIAWPGSRVLASGSDDTTIRLWGLETRALLGTLSAEQGTNDWVAYTPDGLFDSSIGGERQVAWRDGQGVLSLEQVYDGFHVDKLTDQLRRGVRPKAPERPRRPPPRLTIDPPPALSQNDPRATLSIALGEPDLVNLRLYHDGIPVQTDEDFRRLPGRSRFTTQVRLRPGLNRFHVMAGRPGAADVEGRSATVEVRYDGAEPPGRLHILALGVSAYRPPDRALQFADRDARQLAEYLHRHGIRAGAPGLMIVLTNREVTEARIDEAFARIRDQVKDRPEDTVVVFMAGHADVINGRFALLLPSFAFRAPVADTRRRGPARRGPIDPDSVLPYVALYRNIARLGALKRLVVIDACQAEAIGDDPGVRQIQERIDGGSQRARTAYLLAARRGEPAGESSALEHGLLTYALLKGLGETRLEAVPGLSLFDALPNADRDHDRVITTEELRRFIAETVPVIAARFPTLVQRTGADGRPAPLRPDANLGQAPRIQASDASFSLIELPTETARHGADAELPTRE